MDRGRWWSGVFIFFCTATCCAEVGAEWDVHWRLAFPRIAPQIQRTEHFLVLGPSLSDVQEVADLAESVRERVLKLLRVPSGAASLEKDAVCTIYILPRRYDYSEFGRMVEDRQLPVEMHSHWRSTNDFSYIVLGPPPDDGLPLETRLGQCFASTLVGSWADVPVWYADGIGHVVAERLNRRHPQIRKWVSTAAQVVPAMKSVAPLLANDLPLEYAGTAHWAFTRFLMGDHQRGQKLLRGLQEGSSFEESFLAVYGAPPEKVCQWWLARNGGGKK